VVDVHSHLYPPWVVELYRTPRPGAEIRTGPEGDRFLFSDAFGSTMGRPIDADFTDLAPKLAFMERWGITKTVLSLANPWFDPLPHDEAMEAARRLNHEFAALEQATDGRIVGLGALPSGPVEAVVRTVHEIADTVGLYGIIAGTRIAGQALDDPALEVVWRALGDRGLPILIHPHHGVGRQDMPDRAVLVALGFPFETSTALARLALAGTLERHPAVRLMACHGGGGITFLGSRVDAAWRRSERPGSVVAPSEVLGRMLYDASLEDPTALRHLVEVVGADHVAFGSDHPFAASPGRILAAVQAQRDGSRAQLLGGAAVSFFGLDRAAPDP
jgi:aminocarboxymuconate-semialdehyde decarboxylase